MADQVTINGSRMTWYGKQLAAWVHEELRKRLARAAELVASRTKVNISVSTRGQGPSAPGEYPHAMNGRLRNSIFWIFDRGEELSVIVGTPLEYGLILERGHAGGKLIVARNGGMLRWVSQGGAVRFAKSVVQGAMAPRPYLARTLSEQQDKVNAILTAPMKAPKNFR